MIPLSPRTGAHRKIGKEGLAMRIISGSARGRKLKELQGTDTRPTTDMAATAGSP